VLGNHDNARVGSRYGSERIDALNAMLLTLPGAGVTYNGEEIGMLDNKNISWEDTKDPAACNTNPSVYMKYSRDPERTPFQWDASEHAGFSKAEKTWLPVNPNYAQLNLDAQKTSEKSHFKFYQKLMKLRGLDTFVHGDFKILALSQHVFAYVRALLDSDTYVVLINIGASNEHVSLKAFTSLHPKLKVVVASPGSEYEEGTIIHKKSIPLNPYDCLVLTDANHKRRLLGDWSRDVILIISLLVTALSSIYSLYFCTCHGSHSQDKLK